MPRPPAVQTPVAAQAARLTRSASAPANPMQRSDSLDLLLQSIAISVREQEEDDLAMEEAMVSIARMESEEAAAGHDDPLFALMDYPQAAVTSEKCTICEQAITSTSRCVVVPCFHEFHLHCINSIIDSDEVLDKHCPTCNSCIHEIHFDINGPDSYSVKKVSPLPAAVAEISCMNEAARQPRLDTELYAMACANVTKSATTNAICSICDQQMTDRSVAVPCFHEFDFDCIDSILDSGATYNCPICDAEILEIQFNINHMDSYSIKPVTGFRV